MWFIEYPSESSSLATSVISGRRLSAPGRATTATFL
jgi:hypothetical protein